MKMEMIKNLSCQDYIHQTENEISSLSNSDDFKKLIYDRSKDYITEVIKDFSVETISLKDFDIKNSFSRGNVNAVYFLLPKNTKSFFGSLNDIEDIDKVFCLKSKDSKNYFDQGFGQNTLYQIDENEDVIYLKSDLVRFVPMYYFDESGQYSALINFSINIVVELDRETNGLKSYKINLIPINESSLNNVSFSTLYLFSDYDEDDIVKKSSYFNQGLSYRENSTKIDLNLIDFSINFEKQYSAFKRAIDLYGLEFDLKPLKEITFEDYYNSKLMNYATVYPKVISFCSNAKDKDLTKLMNEILLDNYILRYAEFGDAALDFYKRNKEMVISNSQYMIKYLFIESLANNYGFDLGTVTIEDLDAFSYTFPLYSAASLITLMDSLDCLDLKIQLSEVLNYVRRTIVNQGSSSINPYIEYVYHLVSSMSSEDIDIDMLYPASVKTELSKLQFDSKFRVFNDFNKKYFENNIENGDIKYDQMITTFKSLKLEGYNFKLLEKRDEINAKLSELCIRDPYILQGNDQKLFFAIYRSGAKKPLGVAKLGRRVNRISGINQNELDKILVKLNNIIDGRDL